MNKKFVKIDQQNVVIRLFNPRSGIKKDRHFVSLNGFVSFNPTLPTHCIVYVNLLNLRTDSFHPNENAEEMKKRLMTVPYGKKLVKTIRKITI